MTDQLVTNYVDAALAQLRRLGHMTCPGKLPAAMRDESIPSSDDWVGWKAIDSTVTDAELNSLEQEAGLGFPPLYRDFLKYRHFVDLTERGVRFERHRPDEWDDRLRKRYLHSRDRIMDAGLLPFGDEVQMDAGPVCFDTNRRDGAGDCPVIFWDHEWARTDKEVQPMFSSSAKMFECLFLFATNDVNFISHYDDDEPSLLPQKQTLLAEFLKIDPDGAGGPARDYWTCWGVSPAD